MYDKVPAIWAVIFSAVSSVGLPELVTGPSKNEWIGGITALIALGIRELLWWVRNRKT